MADWNHRANDLFLQALDLPGADRPAFLAAACRGDDSLRRVVELLLSDHASAARSQADADPDATRTHADPDATHTDPGRPVVGPAPEAGGGAVIGGKYALVEPVGEGGMGSVWRAEQTAPVRRAVAVKLIKAGMDSKQVLGRFEAERQALAVMDHPNIATVFDGGVHDGRPYFVMELVRGVPITDYCDAHRLTPPRRLELFVQVCHAIQHAHQKGVIHRDIKPSNVLVAEYDGRPVAKVIDFGVAKATRGGLSERTLDTGPGWVVGTPAYMSPEQATFDNPDVDTRSDVYSLGVLLYELLAGSPPFSGAELKLKGVLEILRVVREEEPPRPSTKLSTADALPNISANRGIEPRALTGLLRNELDWVVMKALEKDRARRYETANGFAADVLRYLSGEPVQAHPPSRGYRLKKFVRRHRPQVIAAGLVALALLGGVVGTTIGLFEARRQERRALDAKSDAEKNLIFAKEGNAILGSVFAGLDPNRTAATLGEFTQTLRGNLTDAVRRLDGAAVGDPLDVARMRHTLASSLLGLGDAAGAIALFEKALATRAAILGPDHPDTLDSSAGLAWSCQIGGHLQRALGFHQDTLDRMTRVLGADDPATLGEMNNLALCHQALGRYDLSVPILQVALAGRRARLGPDHPDVPATITNLALGYDRTGQLAQALPLYEEALKLLTARFGPDHSFTLSGKNNLALGQQAMGRLDQALPLLEQVLDRRTARLGADHPDTLVSLNNLAMNHQLARRFDRSVPLYEQALRRLTAVHSANHPTAQAVRNNLALGYRALGQIDKALPLLEATYTLRKAELGPHNRLTLLSKGNLAAGYNAAGQTDKAMALYRETLDDMATHLGADDPSIMTMRNNLAVSYARAGRYDDAVPLLKATLDLRKAKLPAGHPDVLVSLTNLAKTYRNAGRPEKAVPLYEEALAIQTLNGGPDHPNTLAAMNTLGQACCDVRYGAKAVAAFKPFLERQRRLLAADPPRLAELLAGVAGDLSRADQHSAAESLLRECLTLREKARPDDWTIADTRSRLGAALLSQRKYAEAEPLLREGYEGLKAREKAIPLAAATSIPESLDRLIRLFTATDRLDDVTKWRAERAKYPLEMAPPPKQVK